MSLNLVNPFLKFGSGGGEANNYELLARNKLTSGSDSISVSFTAKENLMVLMHLIGDTAPYCRMTVNSDTSANYSWRYAHDGATDTTGTSQNYIIMGTGGAVNRDTFYYFFIENDQDKEKLFIGKSSENDTAGSGTAPERDVLVAKWDSTSAQISSITLTDTEIVVLGYDNDQASTPAWEELGTFTGSSPTATISEKKYLWMQGFVLTTGLEAKLRVGNGSLDSNTNYATRLSSNGGSEDVTNNVDNAGGYTSTTPVYWNLLMINDADYEKLGIYDLSRQGTAGAGNAPNTINCVFKWANTSDQLDTVGLVQTSGTIDSKTAWTIWGFD
jgi:hypothetical protein